MSSKNDNFVVGFFIVVTGCFDVVLFFFTLYFFKIQFELFVLDTRMLVYGYKINFFINHIEILNQKEYTKDLSIQMVSD